MAVNTRVIALLESIDLSLRILAKREPERSRGVVDLDGKYGNPVIRAKDPRDWQGESMKGRRLSECPPEYLDLVAERCDYFASKESDQKKQGYALLDAQRARGWAARLRSGWTAPSATTSGEAW